MCKFLYYFSLKKTKNRTQKCDFCSMWSIADSKIATGNNRTL